MTAVRQFTIFLNPYYWRTALLISRSNLAKQYRNSFLGSFWTLLQPLSVILVYAIIMPMILRFPVENYVLYIISTLPLWTFISTTLIQSGLSLLTRAETLKRCMVSSTVFPVADVLHSAYTYLLAFGTMFCFALIAGFPVSWHVLMLPLYLLPVLAVVMALAVGIAFVAPYVRDVGELLTVTFNVLFWFSAVVFPMDILPENVQAVLEWNPFYILMQPIVQLVYYHQLPDTFVMMKLTVLLLASTMVGYTLYRLCRQNYVYYL